ncbi:MAG: DHHA1 domain-containing protein [Nanoarchaeota archaeon]|nr:DHHA1 domain-containing protein [Nanoarchaeota archaeon]
MIPEKLFEQAREKILAASKPLIFFDEDGDGLASYALIKKHYDKGIGVALRTNNDNNIYLRKIEEHRPDLVITLDKPAISQELVDQIKQPMIVIDHHPPNELQGVININPRLYDKEDTRPTTHWAYHLIEEDINLAWIAATGIVYDYFLPDPTFLKTFPYPQLFGTATTLEEARYEQPIGTLVNVFLFILKGSITEQKKYLDYFMKINDPYDILEQKTPEGKKLWQKYYQHQQQYEAALHHALQHPPEKNYYFLKLPKMETSYTSPLSNELIYRLNVPYVIIAREKEDYMVFSFRSKKGYKILPYLEKALKETPGATGGGHDQACGAYVPKEHYENFIKKVLEQL